MIRTSDATFLNAVANDPTVRPSIGPGGLVDLGPILANPANLALINDHGGFVFEFHDPGRYELHTLFLPTGRGAQVLTAAADAFRIVFTETEAIEIVTQVPACNPAAALMARKAGFVPIFSRPGAWHDGSEITYFMLGIDGWRALDAMLQAIGHGFHEMIEMAKRDAGSELPSHPDDEAHDRAVGAAVLMLKAGQARKSVWSYNRWARFAGYAPISLCSEAPPLVDVVDAVVGLSGDGLEVVTCR